MRIHALGNPPTLRVTWESVALCKVKKKKMTAYQMYIASETCLKNNICDHLNEP